MPVNASNDQLGWLAPDFNLRDVSENQMSLDIENGEVKNIVLLSSFLANGAGARGTPTIFVNEEFFGGYISLQQMKNLLK